MSGMSGAEHGMHDIAWHCMDDWLRTGYGKLCIDRGPPPFLLAVWLIDRSLDARGWGVDRVGRVIVMRGGPVRHEGEGDSGQRA